MEFHSHKNGTFCWVDLATSNVEASKNFYKKLFGWKTFCNNPVDGMIYTTFTQNEKAVGAIYELMKEHKDVNIPPHWLCYIACDDIQNTVEKIKSEGGTILMPPCDASDAGIMALFQDLEGATVGLWQAKKHIGAEIKYVHGAICWNELASRGNDANIRFYENVFNLQAKTEPMGDMNYTTFNLNGEFVCGLYVMPEFMKDVPPHWLVYFTVNSLDTALSIIREENGEILMPKAEVPGVGIFAVVKECEGAVFGLLEPAEQNNSEC